MYRIALFVTLLLMAPAIVLGQEFILYTGGDGGGAIASLQRHADRISVIAPQTYGVDAEGQVSGHVSDELLAAAARLGVRVMPLIHNPGFNQETIHSVLDSEDARRRVITFLVNEGLQHGFWGWQFDFENIHTSHRDAFTRFYRETATALHGNGMTLSVAVVPTDDRAEESGFSKYMQDNWRGSFDVSALAEAGDFISLMTYAQHGGPTAPGPIAGLPWMRRMIDFALGQGVPANRMSIGIPFYSGYWYPGFDETKGARVVGSEISHERAMALIADAETRWLPEQGATMAFWEHFGTFQWVFMEDARSFESKMGLFDEYPGLRGASIWVLGAEDPEVWPLIPARE